MVKYTYLLIDLGSIIIPFIFSFHPKLKFHKDWKHFIPAVVLVGIAFLLWDEYFTRIAVWGFNEDYLTGIYFGHLPLEEILFFVCIPYSCVFTYHIFRTFGINPITVKKQRTVSYVLVAILSIALIVNFGKFYTTSTFALLIVSIIVAEFYIKFSYLGYVYFAYLILLIPFFITNGILTGSFIENAIVWYDDTQNMGIRIATVPIEDAFYGMLLVLWNVILLEYFKKSSTKNLSFKK